MARGTAKGGCMTMTTRRAALVALAGSALGARANTPAARLSCSTVVASAPALLGRPLEAHLACVAGERLDALSLADASLQLELWRVPPLGEPTRAFPNREGTAHDGVLERTAPAGRQALVRGQSMTRTIDLIAQFPRLALDTGELAFAYRVGDGPSSVSARPVRLTVESGPAAVAALFDCLSRDEPGVRARSAGLLHRMTAHSVGFDPTLVGPESNAAIERWRQWWNVVGSRMRWDFASAGAAFGGTPGPLPARLRSHCLGGVAYRIQPVGTQGADAIVGALNAWQRGAADIKALQGRGRVADQLWAYPSDDTVMAPTDALAESLQAALARLASLTSTPPEASGASLILATVACCPEGRFVPALAALGAAANDAAAWRDVALRVDGLLDVLDPQRNPTDECMGRATRKP